MGILGSIIGGIAGALLGNNLGIGGFGGAINGAIPGAVTGLVVGSLLEDKATSTPNAKFPLKGTPKPTTDIEIKRLELKITESVCKFISMHGGSVPEIDDQLSEIARYKSQDMASTDEVSFEGGTYGSPSQMLEGFGYVFNEMVICVGDNFFDQPNYLVDWMNCRQVKDYLLHEDFIKIGVGYVKNKGYFTVIMVN